MSRTWIRRLGMQWLNGYIDIALLYYCTIAMRMKNAESDHNNASRDKNHNRGFDRRGSGAGTPSRTQVRPPSLQVHRNGNRPSNDSEGDKGLHSRTSGGRFVWETSRPGRHQECAAGGGTHRPHYHTLWCDARSRQVAGVASLPGRARLEVCRTMIGAKSGRVR